MRVAAGDPVTRPELEASLAATRLTWRVVGFMVAVNALLVVKLIP